MSRMALRDSLARKAFRDVEERRGLPTTSLAAGDAASASFLETPSDFSCRVVIAGRFPSCVASFLPSNGFRCHSKRSPTPWVVEFPQVADVKMEKSIL